MLRIAEGELKVSTVVLVSIGVMVLIGLALAIGVQAFLAGAAHYAPWEQIWAG